MTDPEKLSADNEKLRKDLMILVDEDECDRCESCGAPLFYCDDYVRDDVVGCWAGVTDHPAADAHPCYAYRAGKPDVRAPVTKEIKS